MVEIHDTHEQGEIVKGWLKENGGAIILGLALAFGTLFGLKQWQRWESSQQQRASAEYTVMTTLLSQQNLDAAVSNYETLKTDFPRSAYTPLASFHMAKARLEAGQIDLAAQLLEHAMENARPVEVQIIARERLARVRLDQGDFEAALTLINGAVSESGFEAQFAEIRGDVHRAKGEPEEAARFYNQALNALETGIGNRAFLEIKIEASGGIVEKNGESS